jgi:hypothetical protein
MVWVSAQGVSLLIRSVSAFGDTGLFVFIAPLGQSQRNSMNGDRPLRDVHFVYDAWCRAKHSLLLVVGALGAGGWLFVLGPGKSLFGKSEKSEEVAKGETGSAMLNDLAKDMGKQMPADTPVPKGEDDQPAITLPDVSKVDPAKLPDVAKIDPGKVAEPVVPASIVRIGSISTAWRLSSGHSVPSPKTSAAR